jgi:hypothetical protein
MLQRIDVSVGIHDVFIWNWFDMKSENYLESKRTSTAPSFSTGHNSGASAIRVHYPLSGLEIYSRPEFTTVTVAGTVLWPGNTGKAGNALPQWPLIRPKKAVRGWEQIFEYSFSIHVPARRCQACFTWHKDYPLTFVKIIICELPIMGSIEANSLPLSSEPRLKTIDWGSNGVMTSLDQRGTVL